MDRRKFTGSLFASSISTLGVGLPEVLNTVHNSEKRDALIESTVIEWNAHIFSPDLHRYPFHSKATYRPDVSDQPDDPLAVYLQRLDDLGIDKAVLVHPEPYGDNHTLINSCLESVPDRLRGTSLFYPRDPEAPNKLEQLVREHPHIISTRFHALKGNEHYLDTFADPGVRALWRKAFELDLVVELHIGPDYAAQAEEAIKAYPGCKVLIDHLAEPHLGSAVDYVQVLKLASLPNVYMKLSGLNHFAQDAPHYKSALDLTRLIADTFGAERMVWGGGTPEIVDIHLSHFSTEEIAMVKGKNLEKLLNW